MSESKPDPVQQDPVQHCANCRFAKAWPGRGDTVACLRYPPQLLMVEGLRGSEPKPMTPIMPSVAWCGEWQSR